MTTEYPNPEAAKEALFLKQISRHKATILQDEGLYRHIRFMDPDSSAYFFELITWPRHLCITGDMNNYVFRRLGDMFEFFRPGEGATSYAHEKGLTLPLNLHYWSEKLIATDGGRQAHGVKVFSKSAFLDAINDRVDSFVEDYGLNAQQREALEAAIQDEIIDSLYDDDDINRAIGLCEEFSHTVLQEDGTPLDEIFTLQEMWDHDMTEYDSHFVWCCRAIVAGINEYDRIKEEQARQLKPSPVPRG